jgi:hypothetical protein
MKNFLTALFAFNSFALPCVYVWAQLIFEKEIWRQGLSPLDFAKSAAWFLALSLLFTSFYLGLEPKRDVTGDQAWGFAILLWSLANAVVLAALLIGRFLLRSI